MEKSYPQRPSWIRRQTNVKVCCLPLSDTSLHYLFSKFQSGNLADCRIIRFSHSKRELELKKKWHPSTFVNALNQSLSSYAVVSHEVAKSGNRQPGCLKLPPSTCYFKPQPLSVVSGLERVLGRTLPLPPK